MPAQATDAPITSLVSPQYEALVCLSVEQVVDLTGFKRAAIYKRLRLHEFPQPIRLGRAVQWRRETILEWMRQQEQVNAAEDERIRQMSAG